MTPLQVDAPVTVVVPCFNEESTLPGLLSRLRAMRSTHQVDGWRFVFVDDGSTDGTFATLLRATRDEPWIEVLRHHDNLGVGAAMRTGFAECKSPVVCTTGCGYPPERLPELHAKVERGAEIVATNTPDRGREGEGVEASVGVPRGRVVSRAYALLVGQEARAYGGLQRAYRREVLDRIHFRADGPLALPEIMVRAALAGRRIEGLPSRVEEAPAGSPEVVLLLGVAVTNATKDEAIARMDAWIRAREDRTHAVFIVNAHTLNLAWEHPEYRTTLNHADVVFADGVGARLAARLKGSRLRDNLVGTDLLPAFFAARLSEGYRYFLLGGAPGTAERAAERLQRDFPGISIGGHHHGFLDDLEAAGVIGQINAAAPDMLVVAMGNPKQEEWIRRHRDSLRVPVAIGVGGLFDHWSGELQRAPAWVRRLNLEWLQILLQQPHKWRRYILGNPKFMWRALIDRGRGGSPGALEDEREAGRQEDHLTTQRGGR